ncbi:unnamed protein product [Prorocentrum cordatum]|uniref:U-box domain-containing protein n=1 Tax=Prorocentrum cordatum TaxID=2364126 RepID=A0ABN9VHF9_9DINO|nr:unnamed protein product [Polarella glacialis]
MAGEQGPTETGEVVEPERLLCPITQIMFRDPCFVTESGNTYERSAVERYWATQAQPKDPLTNMPVLDTSLHPNWGTRREVQGFLDDHPGYVPQGWPDRTVPGPAPARAGASAAAPRCRALACAVLSVLLLCGVAHVLLAEERRPQAAEQAARHREGHAPGYTVELRPPAGSKMNATNEDGHLIVSLPAKGLTSEGLMTFGFSVFWLGFTATWTTGALRGGAPLLFVAFSLPFWGVGVTLFATALKDLFVQETLDLGADAYEISRSIFGRRVGGHFGLVDDLQGVPVRACNGDSCQLVFEHGVQDHIFGDGLLVREAEWLQKEVQRLLNASSAEKPRADRFGGAPPSRDVRAHHEMDAFDHHRHMGHAGVGGVHFQVGGPFVVGFR